MLNTEASLLTTRCNLVILRRALENQGQAHLDRRGSVTALSAFKSLHRRCRLLKQCERHHHKWTCRVYLLRWSRKKVSSKEYDRMHAASTRLLERFICRHAFDGLKAYLGMRRAKAAIYKKAERDRKRLTRGRFLHRWLRHIGERKDGMKALAKAYHMMRNITFFRCFQGFKEYWRYKRRKYQAIAQGEAYFVSVHRLPS
jgi:hypothetical protein